MSLYLSPDFAFAGRVKVQRPPQKSIETICADVLSHEPNEADRASNFRSVKTYGGKEISNTEASEIAKLFTKEELQEVFAELEFTNDDTHVWGYGEVKNYKNKKLLSSLPSFFQSAQKVGFSRRNSFHILIFSLQSNRYDFHDIEKDVKRLTDSFEIVSGKVVFQGSDLKTLLKLIIDAGKNGATEYAYYNLGFGLEVGFTLEQLRHLFWKIGEDRGTQSPYTFKTLQGLFKQMSAYSVNPSVAFKALDALFEFHVLDGAGDGRLSLLKDGIEVSVLGMQETANHFFEKTVEIIEQQKRIDSRNPFPISAAIAEAVEGGLATALSGPKLLTTAASSTTALTKNTHPDFPIVSGRIRHSRLRYQLQKSFEEGLADLKRLTFDETAEEEGAFVFDPDSNTWFSLGSTTHVVYERRAVRTEFEDRDLSEFGSRPIFIHIHPHSMEWITSIPREVLADETFKAPLEKFSAIMPSQADMGLFAHFLKNAAKPIQPRFLIITSLGTTEVKIENLAKLSQVAENFLATKDAVITDPKVDLRTLRGASMIEILKYCLENLNARIKGTAQIKIDSWKE